MKILSLASHSSLKGTKAFRGPCSNQEAGQLGLLQNSLLDNAEKT